MVSSLAGRQPHAFRHMGAAVGVILALAPCAVSSSRQATLVGKISPGLVILQLVDTAFAAAVAQAFPLRPAHPVERHGFPEGPGVYRTWVSSIAVTSAAVAAVRQKGDRLAVRAEQIDDGEMIDEIVCRVAGLDLLRIDAKGLARRIDCRRRPGQADEARVKGADKGLQRRGVIAFRIDGDEDRLHPRGARRAPWPRTPSAPWRSSPTSVGQTSGQKV